MEAAEQLFAAQGYAATSVGQIAQSAGTNRALLYYYFRNKRDLYWAIMKGGLQELATLIAVVGRSPGGAWERLEQFVRGYYELLVRRHHVVRMIFREMTGLGEQLALPIEENLRRVIVAVRGIIEEGVKSGEFDGVDPELTAFWLSGMIHVFFTQRLATGRALPTDVVAAQTLSLFRRGAQTRERKTKRGR
jgi:AcrR family transcriptional regulator